MKKIILMVLSILMATTAFAQNGELKTITISDAERKLVEQNSDFAFNLFRKTRDTESQVISPLSITYALGMLNNGAEGITREEICQVLSGGQQTDNADVATMNAFCRKMLTESALLDEDTRVAIANTIFFNGDRKDIALKAAFKDAAATYYDAKPSVLSFSDEATLGTINQWATDQTDGMIRDLLKPEDMENPNLVSFLLNAICFKGAWASPFDEKHTREQYFDDEKRTAMMMWQNGTFRYAETNLYQSVILPYGNGSYQMTIFLPFYGKTIDDLLAVMNSKNWNAADYQDYKVSVLLPRIETDTNQNLEDIMASLGMKNAFQKDHGHGFMDFCYAVENENSSDTCWISLMRQKAHLKLDEKGTEAAASTTIGIVPPGASSEPLQRVAFYANRPFLYIISERSTGSIFFIGQYMGEPIENLRHDISLSDDEQQLVKSNNDFAFRLFSKARGEESSIMSPLSITYALGMMNNGAAGQTQQEINDVLGFGEAGADGINNFCRKMLTEAPTLDKETVAEIANTIYVNSGTDYELQPDFVYKANTYYDATPTALDFYDDTTIDIINQWANEHTHGMIPTILNKSTFNCDAASYLLNALYFKGTWVNKFDKANTSDESFNGGAVVPMMHQSGQFDYTENDLYQAVRMYYGNCSYLMTIFLPREGKTIADVLATIDGSNWQFWRNGDYIVDLKIPRFKTDTGLDLVPVMQVLGMPTAFTGAAEFPYFGNRSVFISNMFQKAVIDLDEEGTEAAAITVIEASEGIQHEVTFHANRPFFYIISEQSTGSIFFIGQYMGEGLTAGMSQVVKETNAAAHPAIYDLQGRRIQGEPQKGLYIQNGKKILK
ncbi:MAG: serpin family protein [Prevotella sp.]|nr:serpin family protein [Prevotella sp.]